MSSALLRPPNYVSHRFPIRHATRACVKQFGSNQPPLRDLSLTSTCPGGGIPTHKPSEIIITTTHRLQPVPFTLPSNFLMTTDWDSERHHFTAKESALEAAKGSDQEWIF